MKTRNIFILTLILLMSLCSFAFADIKPPAEVNHENNYVIFGAWNQTFADKTNFNVANGDEPIQWIILAKEDTKLLLLSKDPLDYQQYDEAKKDFTWRASGIRRWLNSKFLNNAFTDDEKEAILTTEVESGGEKIDKDWPTASTEKTSDRIFLLSYKELKKYLNSDKIEINDYVDENDGRPFNSDDTWWLRSSGKKANEALFAGHNKKESGWLTDWRCIRPAMWIDTSLFDWDNSRYTYMKKAQSLAKESKYDEAYAITDKMGSYWNSIFLSLRYRCDFAVSAANQGDYTAAIERYLDAKQYANSYLPHGDDEQIKATQQVIEKIGINTALIENRYKLAIQTKENGQYKEAYELFKTIGHYKDSMEYILDCFKKLHIQYSILTRPDSVVNTGMNNGYLNSNLITGDDPHFAWSLGQFILSGYTERHDEYGKTVFMKTPGDNLVLWFDLQQDINALNNEKNLTIANDTDGYDVRLSYPKQKDGVGHGLLVVRHTDFRNDAKVQAYTNYLEANGDNAACTTVEINEEGTYDIALDYEIKKDELFDKYNNYRMACSFEVRNGNSNFYLFDITTGSELQDYSRSADGFRIDLANSHTLSINVTRYAINEAETGLDARKTGLASDQETFEKIGYYEITVTNKETNIETVKHIFVGRASDLKEYQELDDRLGKFSDE